MELADLMLVLSIPTFGGVFWGLNHVLHRMCKEERDLPGAAENGGAAHAGERPLDRHMWWLSFVFLLPVLPLWILIPRDDPLVVVAFSLYPVVAMIMLGRIRGRQSGTAIMYWGLYGAEVATLLLVDQHAALEPCLASQSIDTLRLCADFARFWLSTWMSAVVAFVALYAAALVGYYRTDIAHWGWRALPEERQALGILYSTMTAWVLVVSFVYWGFPALRLAVHLLRVP